MKVICAGQSKTGTKTIAQALRMLDYKVYDYAENFYYLYDDWMKAFNGKITKEDFQRMFKDVDAGCDLPFNFFWEEILEAFPDAKVILMVRDEEDWITSMVQQAKVLKETKAFIIPQYLTPTGNRMLKYSAIMGRQNYGDKAFNVFTWELNKQMYVRAYRRHNACVLQRCPKDKLLVYNCKEGWEPICKFLGIDVPDEKFPHKNVRGNIVEELLATHPLFLQIGKEMKIVSLVVLLAGVLGSYGLFKSKFWQRVSLQNIGNCFKNIPFYNK